VHVAIEFEKLFKSLAAGSSQRSCNWSFTNSTGDGNTCESANRAGSAS
jgi:hypothetical protein